MTDEKWRSPNNDYGPEVGLDNGDVETFKKEPEEALARETGQNSNDARYNSSYTKMEYKLFEVEHDAIPGIDELSEMIEACYEYKKELPKEAVQLKRMLERSHDKKIKCLRISDFHTSGLEGVLSNDAEKPFYLLTKGSGISYKGSGAGGSKGIGKYAAFVNSNINTVFYSTYNKDNERGYIGVSKLRSVMKRYAFVKGKELEAEDFSNINCFELAQLLMNESTDKSIKDFYQLAINGEEVSENE